MRNIVVAAVAVASFVACVGAAQAEAPASRRISTAKIDFNDPQSVKVLHERMRRAAREACNSGYAVPTQLIDADRACTEQTLSNAVAKVDRPLLTAMQRQRQQTAQVGGYYR